MPTSFFDLETFDFSKNDDFVGVDEIIDIGDGTGSPYSAILLGPASIDAEKGRDTIDGALGGTIESDETVSVSGLSNQGQLFTGKNDDSVTGTTDFLASVHTTVLAVGISGRPSGLIDTGKGSDTIVGHAELRVPDYLVGSINGVDFPEPDGQPTAIGIDGGTIIAGKGNDEVAGIAAVNSGAEFLSSVAIGLNTVAVDTGAGSDRIEGTASVNAADFSENAITGILGGTIDAGKGNDEVIGTASASDDFDPGAEEFVLREMAGLRDAQIDMGRGSDTVTGSVEVGGQGVYSWDIQDSRGIDGGTISTGKGNDVVTGSLSAELGAAARGVNIAGIGDAIIDTGAGNDAVSGTVDYSDGDSFSPDQAGIKDGFIDTGSGNDTVVGSLSRFSESRTSASNSNGIDGTEIDTGEGNDRIEGTSSITAVAGVADAHGDGIVNATVRMGAGADTIVGTGADIDFFGFDPRPDDHSDGIQASSVDLGEGDDHVIARGATSGVRDVFIFGDDGDDIFDLHSGTGLVDGGDDIDLLILSGNSADFAFTDNGGLTGNIADGGVTDLDIAAIERFLFDDGAFDFGDLF